MVIIVPVVNGITCSIETLENGEFNPNWISDDCGTALIWLLRLGNRYPSYVDVALKIIKSGEGHPEQVSINNNTALIWACRNENPKVALALVKTGKSNPSHVNNYKRTALIWACKRRMISVAIEIIKTGNSNPDQISLHKKNALELAYTNNMPEIVSMLNTISGNKIRKCKIEELIIECCEKGLEDNIIHILENNEFDFLKNYRKVICEIKKYNMTKLYKIMSTSVINDINKDFPLKIKQKNKIKYETIFSPIKF